MRRPRPLCKNQEKAAAAARATAASVAARAAGLAVPSSMNEAIRIGARAERQIPSPFRVRDQQVIEVHGVAVSGPTLSLQLRAYRRGAEADLRRLGIVLTRERPER